MDITHAQPVFSALALLCATCAAWTDLRTRRVPNPLTGAAVLAGLLLHLVTGGAGGFGSALLACFIAGGLFFIPYLAGGMGAGDVKLMAALGAVSGLHALPSMLLATAVSGGVVALYVTIRSGALMATLENVLVLLRHHAQHGMQVHREMNVTNTNRLRIPYAVPACMGCLYAAAWAVRSGR